LFFNDKFITGKRLLFLLTTAAKIRLWLALLCAAFLLTGIIVQWTFTPKVDLTQTAAVLEKNLHDKESYVKQLADKDHIDRLKRLASDNKDAINFIEEVTLDRRIMAYTYVNDQLSFWSSVKVIPKITGYKEGAQFIRLTNGYYEVIKKTDGSFSALFFIPVKIIYPFENRYLRNNIDRDLLDDDNIDIADFADKAIYDIHNIDGKYIFSIELKPDSVNLRYYDLQITLWLLSFLTLCVLVHNICNLIARRVGVGAAVAALLLFLGVVRFINLYYGWPVVSHFQLFSPQLYHYNSIFPSLGDFCLNIFAACWLASFLYHNRHRLLKNPLGKQASYAVMVVYSLVLIALATLLLRLFYSLVLTSNISFDVTNVFNLSGYSFIGVLILCFSFMLYYLLNDTFLVLARRLDIPASHKVLILLGFMSAATLYTILQRDTSLFYILVGVFTAIRVFPIWHGDGKLTPPAFLGLLATCSLISAIKLNHFQELKEHNVRKALVQKLVVADDPDADISFRNIEKQIINDSFLLKYFRDSSRNNQYLKTRFQKLYFDGYLSKYDFQIYAFDDKGQLLTGDKNYDLNVFKDLVAYSSLKVSNYFYRETEAFGFQRYFAILPIFQQDNYRGTIVVWLQAKPLVNNLSFPELLVPGDVKNNDDYANYSYAYYDDGHLVNKAGPYAYNLRNYDLTGLPKRYLFKQNKADNYKWYKPFEHYSHLIYELNSRNVIIVTHQEDPLAQSVTSLTFFFVTLLTFSMVIIFITWSWARIRIFNIKNQRIRLSFRINLDKILYRSRIQFSVIITVVITLLLVGAITFQTISTQYREQQDDMIREKLRRIAEVFENGLQKNLYTTTQAGSVKFNEFADTYNADLTLYNLDGVVLLTTQPKLYDYSILMRKMNARAYITMRRMQRSEFLNDEKLGSLNYKSAYIPIKNIKQQTIAFLQLPYFANATDHNNRIGSLLNAMINIYALVFIAIGLVAVIIARQITSPLTFIQYNLSKTIYGRKNEPIVWHRDDEIGALVKEYNKMIAELENSAAKLAQSERESAWREMAKQVAHEIKNPLTPLKLGLQLLDKAWKDKDPKFDQKFERFSKSFVEQIESLSSIASEFSAFAKMPDTRIEQLNIFEMINQAVIIFRQMDNITIDYQPGTDFIISADRDQLLRCFNNLLKNAIEAVPQDRAGHIKITHKTNGQNTLIMLADNGNGIPEHLRERIFEPNFTTKSSGTGLGLAFVKNSIENAGGKIWFETEIGKGTTFYLSLTGV